MSPTIPPSIDAVHPMSIPFVKGHRFLPTRGHETCPLVATVSAHWWPRDCPTGLWAWAEPPGAVGDGRGSTRLGGGCDHGVGQ